MNSGLSSLAELSHLRSEAMTLFEQCLTNGDDSTLVAFIERQLIHEPPRLQLLHDLGDDLQQRLLSLREYHFDVRDRVVSTFNESYNVDITPLAPPDALDRYHHLTSEQILLFANEHGASLSDQEAILVRKMVDASLKMAQQLYSDITLTSRVQRMVIDWLEGMNATIARQYWNTQGHTPHQVTRH